MPTTTATFDDTAINALDKVLIRSLDARAGFQTLVEKAEPEFRPVAEEFLALHTSHAERLSILLKRRGLEPETDGSFMAKINEGVVSIRALVDEIDEDVMDNIRSGETFIASAFKEAIDAVPVASREHGDLIAMKVDLDTLLARTSHLD